MMMIRSLGGGLAQRDLLCCDNDIPFAFWGVSGNGKEPGGRKNDLQATCSFRGGIPNCFLSSYSFVQRQ